MKVRFVPSVDDYIYLASKINTDGINNSFDQKAYTVFLSLNAVVAPAILLYSGYVVVGLAFFVVNVAIYLFVLHGMTERHYRKFYTQVTADLPATKVEVEITPATIIRSFDGDSLVITWKNISLIEESGTRRRGPGA